MKYGIDFVDNRRWWRSGQHAFDPDGRGSLIVGPTPNGSPLEFAYSVDRMTLEASVHAEWHHDRGRVEGWVEGYIAAPIGLFIWAMARVK